MRRRTFIKLRGKPKECMRLESYVASLALSDPGTRSRLLIIATELFDNVCKHSGLGKNGVLLSVRVSPTGTALLILFKSSRFKEYAERRGQALPSYSKEERRYRGLGMQMVRNLSRSVHLHAGSSVDGYLVTV
jgi:anti-sigma regulatory factor (Ser/Thr protein kinase)